MNRRSFGPDPTRSGHRTTPGRPWAVVWAAVLILGCATNPVRIYRQMTLFDEGKIVHNFQNMDEIFPVAMIAAGDEVFDFERGVYALPETFEHRGRVFRTREFLDARMTNGLLILDDDRVVHEEYANGHSVDTTHIAWSVSKSFVSALVGIAVAEGDIESIDQPLTDYVPELAGSGYDGVTIRDALQMSSGVRFDEDYGDPDSDINRMGESLAFGKSLLEFSATLERERPPGTVLHYVSIDTQVLGQTLVRATGKSLADYTSEKLWIPLGMSPQAFWGVDGTRMEMAFGGLNATLRDFARFGFLYLNEGEWNGKVIVSKDWVKASTTPGAPHLEPGLKAGDHRQGYGYQWWIPEDGQDEFMALGVYNQMIYVDTARRVVAAVHSANRDFQRDDFEPTREAVSLFRAVARELQARRLLRAQSAGRDAQS